MIGKVPRYLSGCVRKDRKGLTAKGIRLLISRREAVDFTDCFGVRDCVEMAILEHFVTAEQDEEIWNTLRKEFGDDKVDEVIASKFGDSDA
jgi:hypothetical protein